MNVRRARWAVLVAGAMAAVGACKGDKGDPGPPGGGGGTGNGGGGGTGGSGAAVTEPGRLFAKLTSPSVPNGGAAGGAPTVTYRLFKDRALTGDAGTCAGGGTSGYQPFTPNFTIAKLVDDAAVPGAKRWQSYINRTLNGQKVATQEGARDTVAGTIKDNGDGSCTYTFKSDLSQTAAASAQAAVTEPYEPGAVTRIGMQNNPATPGADRPAFDGWVDFVPASGQVQTADPRALVATAACNQCHRDLAHHGGKRLSVEYCVTCHNAGTPDPEPTSQNSTTLDLGVMVHKIHRGGALSSVTGKNMKGQAIPGATPGGKLVVNGEDYTFVGFPQDVGNCTACHAATTGTGNDAWKNQPSIAYCGACHDRVDFAAGGTGTPKPGFYGHPGTAGAVTDAQCKDCHADGKTNPVTAYHRIGITPAAQQLQVLKLVSVTSTAPGQKPVVTFRVTDPANAGAAVDVTTDPKWNSGGASRLFIDLAWSDNPGQDWTNRGSGAVTGFGSIVPGGSPAPGQPISFDAVAAAKTGTKNADGSFTVTSPTAIDPSAKGSGMAVLEGHPASGTPPAATPVRSDTLPFAITGGTAVARRQVVDIQKCDKCHGFLSLHGGNRNDNIDACVVCHNGEATDVTQRKGTSIDGKAEQTIQFGAMIHGIHAGKEPPFTQGVVVYAFTGAAPGAGTPNATDFREVRFPEGNSVGRCDMCHADTNPYPSADTGIVNGITTSTLVGAGGALSADQSLYLRTTPVAAICSSCHQNATAAAHMKQNGAAGVATIGLTDADSNGPSSFGPSLTEQQLRDAALAGGTGTESCTVCHGKGSIADPALFHGR